MLDAFARTCEEVGAVADLLQPRGSEYPNSKVLAPKINTLKGVWTLEPYYLGTWTLRVGCTPNPTHRLLSSFFLWFIFRIL